MPHLANVAMRLIAFNDSRFHSKLWSLNFQVIVVYRNESVYSTSEFWQPQMLPSPWPRQDTIRGLVNFLNNIMRHPSTGFVHQAVLTPTATFIVLRYYLSDPTLIRKVEQFVWTKQPFVCIHKKNYEWFSKQEGFERGYYSWNLKQYWQRRCKVTKNSYANRLVIVVYTVNLSWLRYVQSWIKMLDHYPHLIVLAYSLSHYLV